MDAEEIRELEIKDPKELKKYKQAIEILKLIAEDGLSVQAACKQVAISPRTYYRWVEQGFFQTIIGGEVTQAFHDSQLKLTKALPKIIDQQVQIATGQKADVTNFDIQNAARFLFDKILTPAIQSFLAERLPEPEKEEEDPAKKFLEREKAWELPPGEKLVETTTRVVERQGLETIEGKLSESSEAESHSHSEDDPPENTGGSEADEASGP